MADYDMDVSLMMDIERHKRAISYGEVPPPFERPLVTTSTIPDLEQWLAEKMLQRQLVIDLETDKGVHLYTEYRYGLGVL